MIPETNLMDTTFWIKVGLSFFIGGSWVALTTVFAERLGSRIGGFVGGLPSTAVVALLFMGLTQTPEAASEATAIMPLAMGFNGFFIIAYNLSIRHGLARALSISLAMWAISATILSSLRFETLMVPLAGWLVLIPLCYCIVERVMTIPSRQRIRITYTPIQLIGRAAFSGSVIACAVLMSKLSGPRLGGIFATFPALFLSTLIITHRTGGATFSRAVSKALMVSGMINVSIYALSVGFFYPRVGLWYGTMLSLGVSLITGYLSFFLLRRWMK